MAERKCEICGTNNPHLLKEQDGHIYCSRCWQSDEVCQKCLAEKNKRKGKRLLFELQTTGDPDDGMVSVETGCIDGNGKKQIAVINLEYVVERCPFCDHQLTSENE